MSELLPCPFCGDEGPHHTFDHVSFRRGEHTPFTQGRAKQITGIVQMSSTPSTAPSSPSAERRRGNEHHC